MNVQWCSFSIPFFMDMWVKRRRITRCLFVVSLTCNGFAVIHRSFLNSIGQSCRLCLQFVWQLSRRQMSVGVLGSPEKNFVDIGQA